jgi:hypothetical protein
VYPIDVDNFTIDTDIHTNANTPMTINNELSAAKAMLAILCALFSGMSAGSGCDDSYQNALRSYAITEIDTTSLFSLYDSHCDQSGELKNQNFDSNAEFAIDLIPIKFAGNFSDRREKFRNFCRTYKNTRFDAQTIVIRTSTPVVEALVNLNQCKAIEADTGVEIYHKFSGPGAAAITFHFKDTRAILKIDGVVTDNFSCRSGAAAGLFSSGTLSATSRLEQSSDFSIVCTRPGKVQNDGSVTYSVGSILVATTYGPYSIKTETDTIYSHHLASEATRTITALEASLKALKERNTQLETLAGRVQNMKVEVHSFGIGSGGNPGGGSNNWFPCRTSPDYVAQQLCPQGSVLKQLSPEPVFNRAHGTCGDTRLAVACVIY